METIEQIVENTPEYKEYTKPSRSPHKQIDDLDKLPAILRQMAGLNKAGTSKLFTPSQLYERALDYFKYVRNNPIVTKQLITAGQRAGEVVELEKPRLPTIKELCLHLGVNSNYINHLVDQVEGKEDEISKQYSIIITCIKDTIEVDWTQKAAVREYDSVFMSKLLGLSDKVEHSGEIKNTVTQIEFIQRSVEDTTYTEVQDEIDNI